LTLASVTPEVQTQDFTGGSLGSNHQIRYRICHRSRVLIKMDNGKDKD
jgi:hypothetical protein